MPSAASSILGGSMSGQLVAARADSYQANGLIRSQQQQQAITSSQTSLQKLPESSQFLYHPQQQMQFPLPPSQQQQPSQPLLAHNTLLVAQPTNTNPHLTNGNIQHLTMSGNSNNSSIMPQSGTSYNNNQHNATVLAPMATTGNLSKNNQHQLAQYSNQFPQQQSFAQQQLQHVLTANNSANSSSTQLSQTQSSIQHLQQQQQQQQQVPMTTIMIPASAAAHLQSASWQIQQAAMQNNPNFQQTPQILVFMIPYVLNNSLPPTIPPTPDQAPNSLNSTLVRQSHSNSSIIRHNHPIQQQTVSQSSQTSSQNRAVSSLSNQTNTTIGTTKQESEKFYIKVNFSYVARSRQELSFQRGEILHILDTLQNNDYGVQYWLATKVKSNGEDADKGLIPNKIKAEEIAIEQRTVDISESKCTGTLDGSSGGVLSASVGRVGFLRRRTAQRSKSLCKDSWNNVVFDIGSSRLPTYERVIFKHPGFCRPVVIFGPLSDLAREKLLRDYPEKYSYPTGLSQSPDHPKVIRLKGVLDVIDQGKHALLDITAQAVEKLNHVNLAPIVIFMKTESKSIIKEFRSRAAKSLDPNARDEDTLRRDGKSSRKLLEQSVKMEKQWFHVFTAILDLSTMGSEMWYRKLRETIENQQSTNVWMSEKKSDKKLAAVSNQHHATNPTSSANSLDNNHQVMYSMPNTDLNQQHPSNCIADSSSMLNERFSEALNLSSTKSTNDLMPLQQMPPPEGLYGNRSQLRNAYAHSLAQKLARASSEPKLNGIISNPGDEENRDNGGDDVADDNCDDNDDDDDDDDDDDEIVKKPFAPEYENTSSISSSNEIAGLTSLMAGGPSNSANHQASQASSSSNFNANIYQHYQYQPLQQHQFPVKPPAPPPPQTQQADQTEHQLFAGRQLCQQQQESIYSARNQLIGNSFASNGMAQQQPSGNASGQSSSSFISHHDHNRDYHQLPSIPNSSSHHQHHHSQQSLQQQQQQQNQQQQHQEAGYHQLQNLLRTQANNGMTSMGHASNGTSTISDSVSTNVSAGANNMVDLARSHEARNSTYQVYSSMGHQSSNYHYYGMNKI